MKITIKTTGQTVFIVDVDETETIAGLKKRIEAQQSYPVGDQKLIYSGKILTDDKTLQELQVKESGFMVLMVTKPKPGAASAPATSSPAPAAVPAPTEQEIGSSDAPPASRPSDAAAPPAATTRTSDTVTGSFLTGQAFQDAINNMMEMGFEREQVVRCMRASYNNPERACEYLFSGIPEHLQSQLPSEGAPARSVGPRGPSPDAPSTERPTPAPQNLFQLAQAQSGPNPRAPSLGSPPGDILPSGLREAVEQNPALLQSLLQQLLGSDPRNPAQLSSELARNPSALLPLLGSLVAEEGGDEGGDEGGPTVRISEADEEAIGRLQELGFSRSQVIQAYLACERNEELAANFLFENPFEDEENAGSP